MPAVVKVGANVLAVEPVTAAGPETLQLYVQALWLLFEVEPTDIEHAAPTFAHPVTLITGSGPFNEPVAAILLDKG